MHPLNVIVFVLLAVVETPVAAEPVPEAATSPVAAEPVPEAGASPVAAEPVPEAGASSVAAEPVPEAGASSVAAEPAVAVMGDRGRSPYALDVLPHSVFTGAALVALGALQLVVEEIPGGLTCDLAPGETRCDPGVVNAWDRAMLGNNSREWRKVSDAGLWTILGGTAAGTVLDALLADTSSPGVDLLNDVLVISEATSVALLCAHGLKLLVRRPRPTHYTDGAPVGGLLQQTSFPSGHVTAASAVAMAYATTFTLRHPDSPWRFAVYGGAGALAVITGLARVFGGRHFYTDVVAGMLVGAAPGFLIPYWHRRFNGAQSTGGRVLSLQPLVGPGTVGVQLMGVL